MMLHLYLSPMSCLYNFFHLFTIADDCHFSSIHFGLRYLGDCHGVIIRDGQISTDLMKTTNVQTVYF